MRTVRISDADPQPLGAPAGWSEETHGHCGALFVRREQMGGVEFMRSAWEIDTSEAARLYAGAQLLLGVEGQRHPVVNMQVGPLPDTFDPVLHAHRGVKPSGRAYVRVEMMFPHDGGRAAFAEEWITGSFSYAVGLAVAKIEILAQTSGWLDTPPHQTKDS